MKTILTCLFVILVSVSSTFGQTTYTISSNTTWNSGSQPFPNPCFGCTFNIASGATLTIETDVTFQNTTFNGGKVVVNNKKVTLWTASNGKTYFNNTKFSFTGGANVAGSAPMILTNTEFNFFGTSFLNSQHALDLTSSKISFAGNSYLLATGGPVDLRSSSIIAGDGSTLSNAYVKINGPVLNIYDNISAVSVANTNNYYFNWSSYNSISNSRSYSTATNTLNCNGSNPHGCQAPYVYGPITMNFSGMASYLSLPVVLSDFMITLLNDNTVSASWITQQEINSNHFEIERSVNGSDWSVIGKLAARGTSNIKVNYSFVDAAPLNGVGYYRLKMVDNDGKFTYSIVKASRITIAADIKVFPNPATDYVNVSLDRSAKNTKIQLVNQYGQLLIEKTVNGNSVVNIPLQQYANGTYIVKVSNDNGGEKTFKLMVNHK
jgi:hypothetical protein